MSSAATLPTASVVAPDGAERQRVAAVESFLGRHPQDGGAGTAKLVSSDGEEVTVPAPLFAVLRQIAATLAQGNGVAISVVSRELSTTEAARALGMSRPTLVRLVDSGKIPSHKVGSHRRLLLQDVFSYRQRQIEQQRQAYENLMLETDALGLNDEQ
jgi:excisionase family DNA binding protein